MGRSKYTANCYNRVTLFATCSLLGRTGHIRATIYCRPNVFLHILEEFYSIFPPRSLPWSKTSYDFPEFWKGGEIRKRDTGRVKLVNIYGSVAL